MNSIIHKEIVICHNKPNKEKKKTNLCDKTYIYAGPLPIFFVSSCCKLALILLNLHHSCILLFWHFSNLKAI